MNRNRKMITLCFVMLTLGLSACSTEGKGAAALTLVSKDETYDKEENDRTYESLTDKGSWYEGEDDPPVTVLYLTVGKGNAEDRTNYTWAEVNRYSVAWYEENRIQPYKCEAVLQEGGESGPFHEGFGYGELAANATVCLRGTGASKQPQKSYRIDIKEGKGRWDGQKSVILNKHSSDPLRFKNRLAYSLMQEIPHMFSARTRFVHLYVKDKTEGKDGLFEDYGLYTAVEQIGKAYLKNHGLENSGQLYQAENFDWGLHSESIQPATSASYQEEDFEEYLEIKGDKDHTKLIDMLKAVNDENITASRLFDTYFDKNNLYYWMAFQMLMGNMEASTGNYYLYSPLGSERWYVISWNNSGILSETYEKMRNASYSRSWNYGIFTFVNSSLYRKLFQDDRCRREFDRIVEDVRKNYLTEENIRRKAEKYADTIKDYIYDLPDRIYARVTEEEYNYLVDKLAGEVEANYQAYKNSLKAPWPFHILAPERKGDKLRIRWEESWLYNGSALYTVELSDSYTFENCLLSRTDAEGTELITDMPEKGQYFIRVCAKGADGQLQDAYEYYNTESGTVIYGVQCFYVLDDGSIEASYYREE